MSTSDQKRPDEQSAAQDLFLRYVKGVRSGGTKAFEALCDEHPEEASYLREMHSIYKLGAALASSQSFHESIRERFGDMDEITLAVEEDSSVHETVATQDDERALKRTYDTSRYSLEGEIARGGMGVVFRFKDQDLNRSIAMKVMYSGEEGETPKQSDSLALARFLEEAQVMAQLDHPGIVPVHEVGFDSEGQIYFTMKLVKGKNFNDICALARENKDGWNVSRALSVLVRVCQAVAFAHSKGVIHRDLKPSNIMVGRFGEAYAMDWGLAKVKGRKDLHDIRVQPDHEATQTSIQSFRKATDSDQEFALVTLDGSVLGTPAYMPPEQASGRVDDVDERSDVYSLGAVLYKLLTGAAPYLQEGAKLSPHTILGLVVQGPPPAVEKLNPKVSAELAAICKKAMNREQADRYESCQDLAEDLQAYLDRRVVRAHRTGAFAEFRSWVSRNRGTATTLVIAITLSILTLVSAAVVSSAGWRKAETNLYFSEMLNAYQSWESGHLLIVHKLLRRQVPEDGAKDRRGFEWHFLASLADRIDEETTFVEEGIVDLAFHTDSDSAFAILDDGDVVRIDLTNGNRRSVFQYTKSEKYGLSCIAVAPDGNTLALGGNQDDWSGVKVCPVDVGGDGGFTIKTEVPNTIAFSPDGRWAASCCREDEACRVAVWNAANGEIKFSELAPGTAMKASVAFSPDSTMLASVRRDGIYVWRISDGTSRLVEFPMEWVRDVAYSPDSSKLAVVGEELRILDPITLESIITPLSYRELGYGYCVAFSPDGSRMAIGNHMNALYVLNLAKGREERRQLQRSFVWRVAFSEDGKRLHSASSNGIRTSDFIDISTDYKAAWGNNISFDRGRIALPGFDRDAVLLDVDAGTRRSLAVSEADVIATAFSKDGKLLATTETDRTVRIWNAEDGAELRRFQLNSRPWPENATGEIMSLAFSPDGTLLACGGFRDVHLSIWDTTSGELRSHQFFEPPEILNDLLFLPDNRLVVGGGGRPSETDLRVYKIDSRGGMELLYKRDHVQRVRSLTLSPNKSLIAVGAGPEITIYETSGFRHHIAPFVAHSHGVRSVVFTPDGGTLLSAGYDKHMKMWSVASGRQVGQIRNGVLPVGFLDPTASHLRLITWSELDPIREKVEIIRINRQGDGVRWREDLE